MNFHRFRRAQRAATTVQAHVRGWHARSDLCLREDAAILIQSSWRRLSTFARFVVIRGNIIMVQAIVRRRLALRLAEKRTNSVFDIQKLCRGFLSRRQLLNYHASAKKIQAAYRGFSARLSYAANVVLIVRLQSILRRCLALRIAKRRRLSCTSLQSLARRWLARRGFQQKLEDKARLETDINSSITIQRLWRGHAARVISRRHVAARYIQKTWRCFDAHVDFMLKVLDATRIQKCVRCFIVKRRFKRMMQAIVALQSIARGRALRLMHRRARRSIVLLQSVVRAKLVSSQLKLMNFAATTIQRWIRGSLARQDVEIAHFSAREIQRIWRGLIQFSRYVEMKKAACTIQPFWRMIVAQQSFNELKSLLNTNALVIQRAYRQYRYRVRVLQAIVSIQRSVRDYLSRRNVMKVIAGVTRLQAVARARKIRVGIPKKVAYISRRIDKANVRARDDPKMRLGFRTYSALDILKTSKRLSELMIAVATLETSTRLSVVCCEVFTNANAAEVLLELIKTCNRSLPHVGLLQHILLTLDNVSRHESLLPSLATPDFAEVFMDLSQVFRDKDGIFCLSMSLLGRAFVCDMDVKVSLCDIIFTRT